MKIFKQLKFGYRQLIYILGDDIGYFAASLSFYTIFSLIPVIWILFFILSQIDAFNVYYSGIKEFIVTNLVLTHTDLISQYLDAFLENAKRMGLNGLLYTAVASILFYKNYQYVVNRIFCVPSNSFWRAVKIYVIFTLMMPVVLGISFYFSDYLQRVVGEYDGIFGIYTVLSYSLIWVLVFVLFIVSPNMKINFRVALLSSFIVSLFWQIAKSLFVYYVVMNQAYATLYGSFSVVMFFLLWIYLSWYMFLQGLRICYLMQNHR
ncbi:MAG: YihY/virulence factor BrkB family protein [Gammaproteobacteria bacterium]|nr:YihY/virulence factor BrkB family protein [Gammaproteobacteria bacterium]